MVSFTITPLTDHTGAEVLGLDFTRPIDAEGRAALSRAFADHHVLVVRDQHFSPHEFKAAARVFGELQQHDKKAGRFGPATRSLRRRRRHACVSFSLPQIRMTTRQTGGRKGRTLWDSTAGGRLARLR
jgi:alpha-ketoglutarate-dependent taurine dioxygenase